ncbi:MAG: hypothetical protein J4F45_00915 [Pseudomonadales bacterium]|nr:hypothetical protein [Pseudomonadales bacterium]
MPDPAEDLIERLLDTVWYEGSSKHKRHPHLFGLEPFNGDRDDATLCDETDFQPAQVPEIPAPIQRGIRAGLIGHTARILWTVADDGWIFEARETNRETAQFHGYPLLPEEAIARLVFDRFAGWADDQGTPADRSAGAACRLRYDFR